MIHCLCMWFCAVVLLFSYEFIIEVVQLDFHTSKGTHSFHKIDLIIVDVLKMIFHVIFRSSLFSTKC